MDTHTDMNIEIDRLKHEMEKRCQLSMWNFKVIIELKTDLKLNDNIQRICLPEKQYQAGEDCFVSGWGHDESKNIIFIIFLIQKTYIFQ